MPDVLVQRFREQLLNGNADVFDFLIEIGPISAQERIALLLFDQQERFARGNRLSIEEYLERLPDLANDPDAVRALRQGEHRDRDDVDTQVEVGSGTDVDSKVPASAELASVQTLRLENASALNNLDIPTHSNPQSNLTVAARQQPATGSTNPQKINAPDSLPRLQPEQGPWILQDRYRISRLLGQGNFAHVYLGFDLLLERPVAIKVPMAERLRNTAEAEMYLREAKVVASLTHPHIVPVYDMGIAKDGTLFVVSRYIEGQTLAELASNQRLSFRQIAEFIKVLSDALDYAHKRRFIHRDVKPANILIEYSSGAAYITDFGLVMHEEDYVKSHVAGTPAYMSPEQTRGEGHRLDGRSDIFSLGIVFYELLTGHRPFGGNVREIWQQINAVEPPRPRSINSAIPAELERICLKAICKRISDRFESAGALAKDLSGWLAEEETKSIDTDRLTIQPKGLRAFDASDAELFLDLLPGLRNRDGLPESVAFWKVRIEETDPRRCFQVGLLYGPSGCGKSSLMKAGVLPRLDSLITTVYLEATADETESRLLRCVQHACPEFQACTSAVQILAAIRRSSKIKLTIVIDQFEQWLHAHPADTSSELVQALLQCDGIHVKSILMVRDDFAMAAARLMRVLDIRIMQGDNFATIDLFEKDHSRHVLIQFGQALGKLPIDVREMSTTQNQFVEKVIDGLAVDDKVIPVQLALFTEMVKKKPWIESTLDDVGGTDGIGANYLEETFGSRSSNPEYRLHAAAAREVLKALLPEIATNIKGHMRSQSDLRVVSGYADRPNDFQNLIQILDGELRLISPASDDSNQAAASPGQNQQYYQLTHDYLVPALREWLTRKQRETRRGRAEIRLTERAFHWNVRQENKQLPTFDEWLSIRRWTQAKNWTELERLMMLQADRFHFTRSGLFLLAACCVIMAGMGVQRWISNQRNHVEAARIVEGVLSADTTQVSRLLDKLEPYRSWSDPLLTQTMADASVNEFGKLHAALGLVWQRSRPDASALAYLQERLVRLKPQQLNAVCRLLLSHGGQLSERLWPIALDEQRPPEERLHAACALASFDPENPTWRDPHYLQFVADRLVAVSISELGHCQEMLNPIRDRLLVPLKKLFMDSTRGEIVRNVATELLTGYASESVTELCELTVAATPNAYAKLFPLIQNHRPQATRILESYLAERLSPDWGDGRLNPAWRTLSPTVSNALAQAGGYVQERYAFCRALPWPEFREIADTMRASGYRPIRIRPWQDGEQPLIAAVWARDDRKWELALIEDRHALPANGSVAINDGMQLQDIAAFPTQAGQKSAGAWIAVWADPVHSTEERRFAVDIDATELARLQKRMLELGFSSQQILTVSTNANGGRLYSAIWSNRGSESEVRARYPGHELIHQPQMDIAVPRSTKPESAPEYAGVWQRELSVSARILDLGTEKLSPELMDCLAAGYRPVSICANAESCKVLLHIPNIPDPAKEQLALKQAAAAATLLRMDAADQVWARFDDSADTRMRSYVLDHLAKVNPFAGSGQTIMNRLKIESEPARLRTLIQAAGELARAKALSPQEQSFLTDHIARQFGEHPDPGVHGVSEWALKQLVAQSTISTVRARYATGKPVGNRQWYLTKSEADAVPITMVIVRPDAPFAMGSPITETERTGGPGGPNEARHYRALAHPFAIAAHEVTVQQFTQFRNKRDLERSISPEPDAPVNRVSWYEAAAFCNWLSEREGIPRDQWCYDPDQMSDASASLPVDYLDRTGYRMPLESEWEFACRAGTTTAHYFGESDRLLGEYACYSKTSGDLSMLSVGSLRPNSLGLFDMLGNAFELTQEGLKAYDPSVPLVVDQSQAVVVKNSDNRVVRGGSFSDYARNCRSAARSATRPDIHSSLWGFRPARTLRSGAN